MADAAAAERLFDVAGRTACVTGASSGLGRRAATVLAEAGALVVGVARRADALEAWEAETRGRVRAVAADLARRDGIPALAKRVREAFGPPEILVHAAGTNPRQPAEEVTDEAWDAALEVNLAAPFFLSRAFAPEMRAAGRGRIVTFASLQSLRAFPDSAPYGASKGGVAQLTRAMSEAWSRDGVTVNALGPGFFPTELTASVFADPERAARNAAATCVGRNGEPEDIDGPLLFLCSDASRYVTGQLLMVDGGVTAK